ncbi:MAG: hypothetical protein AAB262_04700 [Elusimicrobiota bacterium]
MKKMLLAALVLSAQTAFAQVRALDQLKAAAPVGAATAAPATPSCRPADPASPQIESDFTGSCMAASISGMRKWGTAVHVGDTQAIAGACKDR